MPRRRSFKKSLTKRKSKRRKKGCRKFGGSIYSNKHTKEELIKKFSGKLPKMYFRKKPEFYTKMMDKILMEWVDEVIDSIIKRYHIDWGILSIFQSKILLEYIKRCSREIIYDKIRQHLNYIDKTILQCMAATAISIATKTILGYDWIRYEEDILHTLSVVTDGACSLKQIQEMEFDMIKTTDWKSCKKVMERVYNEPNMFWF